MIKSKWKRGRKRKKRQKNEAKEGSTKRAGSRLLSLPEIKERT